MNKDELAIYSISKDSSVFRNQKNKEDVIDLKISRQSTELMDQTIISNINNCVDKNDELWILGDFCWAKRFQEVSDYRDRINCHNIYFIYGNHDKFSRREYNTIFQSVKDIDEIEINKKYIVMCHYAMLSWNRSHYKSIMLHGHSHGTLVPWLNEHLPQARILDVGVDSHNYMPWSFEEITEYMNSKAGTWVVAEGEEAEKRKEI